MSDLGILSHHYQLSADLCERLNQALVITKKKVYQLPGHELISDEAWQDAVDYLRTLLASLLTELHPISSLPETPPLRLPPSVIQELQAAHQTEFKHYVKDLQTAYTHFLATPPQITARDLARLDEMGQAVSTDLSAVYHRMRRR